MASNGPSTFPIDPQTFDADDRISYSTLDQKFLLVADDGSEYEFDDALRRWIPVLDDELAAQQQAAYKVQGVDEEETVEQMRKKRKKEYINGEDVSLVSLPPLSNLYYFNFI
jgi:HIV Tat-specific factor 1